MSSDQTGWVVTLLDGTTERMYGRLTVSDGVLWITSSSSSYGYIHEQRAWPLTSVKTWERECQ